jgi:preprotein translocase subunit SecG
MTTLFILLIILASVVLAFIVLVQNPKGGGLAGNVAGFSNQFMGVKQTTDVLEKGTWIFAGIVAALSLFSVFFLSKSSVSSISGATDAKVQTAPAPNPTTLPGNTVPFTPGQQTPAK